MVVCSSFVQQEFSSTFVIDHQQHPSDKHHRLMEYSSLLWSIWQDVRSEDSPALVLSFSFLTICLLFRFRDNSNIVLTLSLISQAEALLCAWPSLVDLTEIPSIVPFSLPKTLRVAWLLLFVAAPAVVQSILGLALLLRSTRQSFDGLAQAKIRARQTRPGPPSSSSAKSIDQGNVPKEKRKMKEKEL